MNYPNDLKYTNPELGHVWIKVDGDNATIGITDFAQDQLGDILFVDLPEVGAEFSKGDVLTEVESSKTASEVPAPFDLEILEVNEDLDDSPENINEDAYANWIAKVKINDASMLDELLDSNAYQQAAEK